MITTSKPDYQEMYHQLIKDTNAEIAELKTAFNETYADNLKLAGQLLLLPNKKHDAKVIRTMVSKLSGNSDGSMCESTILEYAGSLEKAE